MNHRYSYCKREAEERDSTEQEEAGPEVLASEHVGARGSPSQADSDERESLMREEDEDSEKEEEEEEDKEMEELQEEKECEFRGNRMEDFRKDVRISGDPIPLPVIAYLHESSLHKDLLCLTSVLISKSRPPLHCFAIWFLRKVVEQTSLFSKKP